MTVTNPWQEITNALNRLTQVEGLAPIRENLEKLQHAANAEMYPPEIFRVLLNIFQKMAIDIQSGRSLNELSSALTSGSYIQPDMDVNNLYQAQGGIFQFFLGDINKSLRLHEPAPSIPIPVVLVVMNEAEATELVSEQVFHGLPSTLKNEFKRLNTVMRRYGVLNWTQRYKSTPMEWLPFGDVPDGKNIERLLQDALDRIQGYQKSIKPIFVDIRTLNQLPNRGTLRRLREFGCIVILDVVSLRHPIIQREYRWSLLDAFPSTLVAAIAPISAVFDAVQHMTIVIERHIDLEFQKRHDNDVDTKCVRVASEIDINRWLKSQALELLPNTEKSEKSQRDLWFSEMRTGL